MSEEWKRNPICRHNLQNLRELHFHFFVSTFHIHPYHSSATMSKSSHPEEVVQQPKDPKSLVHLTLRTVSFWNWQTPLFLHLSVFQKDAGNLFNPQNRIQWPRSNEHPVGSPSFPHGCSDRSLNTLVRSVIRPSHIPLGKRLPSQLFVKKTATPEAQIRETTDSWLLQKWSHQIGGRSRHAMRKATLKSRDFTLLIQPFWRVRGDRSVDVGVSKYTS